MKRRKPMLETYHAILKCVKQQTRNDNRISRTRMMSLVGLSHPTGTPYLQNLIKLGLLNAKENGKRRYLTVTQEGEEVLAQLNILSSRFEGTK